MNNRGSSLVSTVLAVAAAAGVGVAGYFMIAGDCSSCTTDVAAATPVAAAVEGDSCCGTEGAVVETVAAASDMGCCAAGTEACCEGENAESCEIKCDAEGAAETVSLTTDAACADKAEACAEMAADCADKAEACTESAEACEGKVCPVTGEPIADSGN